MNAIILSIGDELVLGQTVDTNSAWISQQLASIGVSALAHVTVADGQQAIEVAIRELSGRCDALLISGGLGPTEDDLTRQALGEVMGQPLEENSEWIAELHRFFEARGRAMPPINRIQAMIPRGAEMIFNTCGTAAGIRAELRQIPLWNRLNAEKGIHSTHRRADDPKRTVYVMPGVPKEMKAMFLRDVLPVLKQSAGGAIILSRTLHTFGLGESALAESLGNLMQRDRNPSVGTTVTGGVVSLRLNSRFSSLVEAQQQLEMTEAACRSALGDLIFGADLQTLPDVVAQLLKTDPQALKWAPSVSTAESCTGGLVAKMLTDVPGSSAYFRQGYVTYSNEAKTNLLNVPPDLMERHGAVSEPVARAMALGCQQSAGTAYALAITGIAGPDGGTPTKPIGSVWIALSHLLGCDARLFVFPGDREMIRDRAAKMALTMLRYHLLGKPLPF